MFHLNYSKRSSCNRNSLLLATSVVAGSLAGTTSEAVPYALTSYVVNPLYAADSLTKSDGYDNNVANFYIGYNGKLTIGIPSLSSYLTNGNSVIIRPGGSLVNSANGVLTNSGSGSVSNSNTLTNSGILNNSGDDAYLVNQNVTYSSLTNSGTINNSGKRAIITNSYYATFVNSGTINNSGDSAKINNDTYAAFGSSTNYFTNNGLIKNSGSSSELNNSHVLINNSTIRNQGSSSLINNSKTLTNNGSLLNESGSLNNSSGGTLFNSGKGSVIRNDGGAVVNNLALIENNYYASFSNSGTLNNSGMIKHKAFGSLNNLGLINNSGTFKLYSGATVGMQLGSVFNNSGKVDFNFLQKNYGTITGDGGEFYKGYYAFENHHIIDPGDLGGVSGTPGTLKFSSPAAGYPNTIPLRFASGSSLVIDVNGPANPGFYDILELDGNTYLDLSAASDYLKIRFLSGASLGNFSTNDELKIISGVSGYSGRFDEALLSTMTPGIIWDVLYPGDSGGEAGFIKIRATLPVPEPTGFSVVSASLLCAAAKRRRSGSSS